MRAIATSNGIRYLASGCNIHFFLQWDATQEEEKGKRAPWYTTTRELDRSMRRMNSTIRRMTEEEVLEVANGRFQMNESFARFVEGLGEQIDTIAYTAEEREAERLTYERTSNFYVETATPTVSSTLGSIRSISGEDDATNWDIPI